MKQADAAGERGEKRAKPETQLSRGRACDGNFRQNDKSLMRTASSRDNSSPGFTFFALSDGEKATKTSWTRGAHTRQNERRQGRRGPREQDAVERTRETRQYVTGRASISSDNAKRAVLHRPKKKLPGKCHCVSG